LVQNAQIAISSLNEQEVRSRVARIRDFPMLTGALQRLLEIIQTEIESERELETLILYDQVLSARVLRVANSAFYGTRGGIGTISRAMLQIGLQDLKSMCLCYLLMQLCGDDGRLEASERERLWKHAFTTAKIASEVSRRRPWISGEKAYVYGLLHDFGRVAMAYSFGEHYRAISSLAELRGVSPWYVELQYGLTHTTIGRWIAAKWALPEVFQRVMEFHHQPERSPSYGPEVKLVSLADILANSDRYPGLLSDPQTLATCRELYISEDEWEDCREALTEIRVQVDQFWNLLK
jgi:HD-like signal output (HDOD) protein